MTEKHYMLPINNTSKGYNYISKIDSQKSIKFD
jgi:hypothetical protein